MALMTNIFILLKKIIYTHDQKSKSLFESTLHFLAWYKKIKWTSTNNLNEKLSKLNVKPLCQMLIELLLAFAECKIL